jgi:hypothetical protein
MRNETRMRAVPTLLLVATAVLFAIGTSIECSQRTGHTEPAATTEAGGSESGTEHGSAGHAAAPAAEAGQKLLGVDTESVGAIVAGVAISLALAAAVWFRRERWWLWLTVVFGVVFAGGDVRELTHQVSESRTGVAVIAAVLVAAHLTIAALAGLLASKEAPGLPAAEADTV